jgi:uncharacterized protein involved in exopolysaccharide biosynthesis
VRRLLNSWFVLLIGALIGAAAGFVSARVADTRFAATTTVLVRQASATAPSLATNSMRAVILNHRVAAAVVKDLGLPMTPGSFLGSLEIADVPGTYLMRLTAVADDPTRAAQAANKVAQEAMAFNETLTRTGDEKLQRVMQAELATARQRMNDAEQRFTEFRSRQRTGNPPLHVAEVEGARLHAELDLATRLYEEIAVQFGKLRLQVAEQAAELLVIEEAHPPEGAISRQTGSRTLLGAISGFMLALLFLVVFAVFTPVRSAHP